VRFIILFVAIGFVSLLSAGIFYLDIPRITKSFGYTTGTSNVAKVNSVQAGVLLFLKVQDHATVKRGDILGEVSNERFTLNRSLDVDQAQLAKHKTSLAKNELINVADNERISLKATRLKIESGVLEHSSVLQELTLSQQRLEDIVRQLERQKDLQSQGFVSNEAVEQKRSEWLQQKLSRSLLERSRLQIEREIATQQEELRLIASRSQ
jgi:multidrug resistance efflux pump